MPKKDETPEESLQIFAKNLAKALEHAGIEGSIRSKGDQLGFSKSFMEDMLKGRKMPSAANTRDIAMRTGVNADWLITGRGEMVQVIHKGQIDISDLPESIQRAIGELIKPYRTENKG